MLHLLAEYRISEHYPCSCRLDMVDSRRFEDRSVGEQFDTATTLRDVYGGKMHARCVTLFVYHVSGPQVNLHKSDFNPHILYGVVPVCTTNRPVRFLEGVRPQWRKEV